MKALPLLLMAFSLTATAQQNTPRAACVYPAGGRQGSSFEITVSGQFLDGSSQAYFAGKGVHAQVKEFQHPLPGKELQMLRDQLETIEAPHRDPPKTPPATPVKPGDATTTQPLATALTPKEAASPFIKEPWTAEERKQVEELRARIRETEQRRARPALSEAVVLTVSIDANASVGNHELRLLTKEGLTNPLVFEVDRLPEFAQPARRVPQQLTTGGGLPLAAQARAETQAEPTPIQLPILVNGQLMPGNTDRYRFHAMRGEELVIAAETRALIPFMADAVPGWFQASLTLRDAKGNELASTDHFRFSQEPVLEEKIPEDGDYLLEIRDVLNRGREDFVYRIRISALPFVTGIFPMGGKADGHTRVEVSGWNLPSTSYKLHPASEDGIHPLLFGENRWNANPILYSSGHLPEVTVKNSATGFAQAHKLRLPVVVNGRIAHPGEKEIFRIDAHAGDEIVAEVQARRLGSPLDSLLTLFDASGRQLAANDDYDDKGLALLTHQADSLLRYRFQNDGRFYLQLTDTEHGGGPEFSYRLRVSFPQPDYELRVLPASINLHPGSILPIEVFLIRRDGFDGSVTLHLKDAPAGLQISGGEIPAGTESVRVTLQAPPEALAEPQQLHIQGEAQINGHSVRHEAISADDQIQAFSSHRMVPAQQGLVQIIGSGKHPALWKPFPDRVRIPVNGSTIVNVELPRWLWTSHFRITPDAPPEVLRVQSSDVVNGVLRICLRADKSIKTGVAGNLLLQAERTPPADPAKKSNNPVKLGWLPALPFVVTTQ